MVTAAHSTTGRKAWYRFGEMFQSGYVSGFLDCVSISKATDRDGYVSTNYRMPPNTKPSHYQAWISEAYEDSKYEEKTIPQLLVLAGYKLEAMYGPEVPGDDIQMEALRAVIDARRKQLREAEAAKKAQESKNASDAAKAADADNAPGGPAGEAADGPPPAK
jgi:hypothetical protein